MIPVAALFSDFRIWAKKGQGLKADFLPNVISFGKRLRFCRAGARIHHRSDGSAYRNCSDLRELKNDGRLVLGRTSRRRFDLQQRLVHTPFHLSDRPSSSDKWTGCSPPFTQPYSRRDTVFFCRRPGRYLPLELPGVDICASPDNHATLGELLAPLFRPVSPVESEARAFSEPCIARRGRVETRDGLFLHFCVECGAWGAFGYGVDLQADHLGRWYCAAHRPQGSDLC